MATGFKTGGRNFKKGQSGNPNGRPGLPKELREAMKMTKKEFSELMIKYLQSTHAELKNSLENSQTKTLDKIVISIILNAIKNGDEKRLDFLMTRIVGKAKSEVDITSGGEPVNFAMSAEERAKRIKQLEKARKQSKS